MHNKVVLVGDKFGISLLMQFIPANIVKAIMASSIRPQYIDDLEKLAEKNNIPFMIQPKHDLPDYLPFVHTFREQKFDLLFCCSYSMIIRKEILESVEYNAVNIHSSLLPLNRGPNPIQWAIIKNERKTGITMHYMDDNLDSGDIIAQVEEKIRDTDTWVSLAARLRIRTQQFIEMHIDEVIKGSKLRIKQDESKATINKRLTPRSPRIDFTTMTNRQVFNLIRAQVSPLKGAYLQQGNKRIYFPNFITMDEVKPLRKIYDK